MVLHHCGRAFALPFGIRDSDPHRRPDVSADQPRQDLVQDLLPRQVSEDLVAITRRLKLIAYEDIGLANPSMGPKVKAACDTAIEVGFPEAVIPLGTIVVEMALSPKSNSGYMAIHAAIDDLEKGNTGPLPPHLKNVYQFDDDNSKYLYPHDFPGAWVNQQYLPDKIKDAKYYIPKDSSKYEEALKERYFAIERAKNKK